MGYEFDEIKRAVTAEDAARRYGLEVNLRSHRAKCPFHGGEHENLSFHGGGFRCFVCDASGTSIDFTMKYLGLASPMEAARRLDRDFNLDLFDKKPTVQASWGQARSQEAERYSQAFIRWCEEKYTEYRDTACRRSHSLRSYMSQDPGQKSRDRRIRKEMRSCGRKYTQLREFLIYSLQQGQDFSILIFFDPRYAVSPPKETAMRRLYSLFASERELARQDVEELEKTSSPQLKKDAARLREAYCLD